MAKQIESTLATHETLLSQVAQMRQQGYRFVTITGVQTAEGHEILYHFDRNYDLHTLRLGLAPGASLCSICGVYFAAVLAENELQDMFGIKVTALPLDLQGHMLLAEDAPRTPLCKNYGVGVEIITPAAKTGEVAP